MSELDYYLSGNKYKSCVMLLVAVGYSLKTGILWRSGTLGSVDLSVCFQSTPANKSGGGAKWISFVLSWTKDRL